MKYHEFISNVANKANISIDQAEESVHAFMEMLSSRIEKRDALHLASQLPNELAATVRIHAENRTPSTNGFFEHIGGRGQHGHSHGQAVWDTLKDTLSKNKIRKLKDQLPGDISGQLD